jgi:4-carboxymuconolactone decarboxylase
MESLNEREQLFVALGAAIGSNCVPCVETIVPKARAAGIEKWELRLALNVADYVRRRPAAKVLSTAKAIVDGVEAGALHEEHCPLDQLESAPATKADEIVSNKSNCCG